MASYAHRTRCGPWAVPAGHTHSGLQCSGWRDAGPHGWWNEGGVSVPASCERAGGCDGPQAIVTFGDWERDASGGVERDVRVSGTRNGSPYDLFAECKDWSTKVGPGVVFEVDGKRRFLGADEARVYANGPFTPKAVQVARDLGVGLYGVVADGDGRTRLEMQSLLRRTNLRFPSFHGVVHPIDGRRLPDGLEWELGDVLREGLPLWDWAADRLESITTADVVDELRAHDLTAGELRLRTLFVEPLDCEVRAIPISLQGFTAWANCSLLHEGAVVPSSMSLGLFDYHSGKAWVPTGEWISYEVDHRVGWEPIDGFDIDLDPASFELSFNVRQGLIRFGEAAPDLDGRVRGWDAWLVNHGADIVRLCECDCINS